MELSPDLPFPIDYDSVGSRADFHTLDNDKWLMDTEVRYRLRKRKGMWELVMVYIYFHNPFQIFCKTIDKYPSERKAKMYAGILQRAIGKDARGNIKTREDAFNICDN